MKHYLAAISAAALLAACTASSDDVGAAGEDDAAGVPEGFAECPDNLVLELADYGEDTLPAFDGDYNAWHMENGSREGVETTASGVQYRVIQPGMENGLSPESGEEVFAMYHGTKLDGSKFDSSYDRGQPFITATTRVIPGWTETLEDMKVCEARTIYLPANMAYGNRGAGAAVAPGETLVFNMQLLRVNREDMSDAVGIDED
ncbi:MAG: FKBP-type peptidyl-prolyl cis-trans isomerase [Litorimonas sp.]